MIMGFSLGVDTMELTVFLLDVIFLPGDIVILSAPDIRLYLLFKNSQKWRRLLYVLRWFSPTKGKLFNSLAHAQGFAYVFQFPSLSYYILITGVCSFLALREVQQMQAMRDVIAEI